MLRYFPMDAKMNANEDGETIMYQYILFDLDGTLTDSKEGIINCFKYAVEKLGDQVPPDEKLLTFIGPPLIQSFGSLGYDEAKTGLAIRYYRERYEPSGKYENAPLSGGVELCARLKEKGYRMAVASSKPKSMCIDICTHFGFAPYLEHIVGPSSDNHWTKADVIREALRLFGLTEKDRFKVLMVGDRKFDVHGAKECGIDCVGVEFFGYAAPGELMDAGAVAVVDSPEALEKFIVTH